MKRTKGFTLIELMIVIAIMGILVAIIVPSFTKYMAETTSQRNSQPGTTSSTVVRSGYCDTDIGRNDPNCG